MSLLGLLRLFALCLICQLVQAASDSTPYQLPNAILTSLEKNQIPPEAMGISVAEIIKSGAGKTESRVVLDWNASKPMNPASTMKLLTTLTSLEVLGPDYRWRTNVLTDGVIHRGVLKGTSICKVEVIQR